MFDLQDDPMPRQYLPGVTVEPLDVTWRASMFDLSLTMQETEQGLRGWFEYNTDLFDASAISRMSGHFKTLLTSITDRPQARMASLTLLSEAERLRQIETWQRSSAPHPQDRCIHHLIEREAACGADRTAVICGLQRITYGQLNQRANHIAHRLLALGMQPDMPVGLCADRSIDMVVGLMAILKAGGAYVPLDPMYPQDRLTWVVEDASLSILVTSTALASRYEKSQLQVVELDAESESGSAESSSNPVSRARPNHLAYVMYTSGSTGKPKGVMIEHRNVLALLHGYRQLTPADAAQSGVAVCPYGFDVSVWELFLMLCFGGTVHLLQPDTVADAERFATYVIEHRITTAYIPPALLSEVASELEARRDELSLQRLLVGVEPIPQRVLQRYRDLSDDLYIVNGYGPTETTVCGTFYRFQTASEFDRRTPLGQSVPGYTVYLVDSEQQLMPIGAVGEILIGGAGIGRGYLNRHELSQDRFIPDPFRPQCDARVYRTGDFGRYLPDGNLEYVGRFDDQVKVRGYRIELGEINAALQHHPRVQAAYTLVQASESGDQRLVSYVASPPTLSSKGLAETRLDSGAQVDHVAGWAAYFDELHAKRPSHEEATFDIRGWTDSYTGQEMPAEEVREWMQYTIDRILTLRPSRVLDIGCGTGLMVFRIGPHCDAYHATDISANALESVRQQ